MANTVIALRKSHTPNAVPDNLANGELAINYADGKLFYKDALGAIQQISSGGNTYSIVNAAGTLLVSDLPTDILSIAAGNNISITADALTDTLTISSNGGASVITSNVTPSSPKEGDLWFNTDYGKLFVYYTDNDSSQWVDASPAVDVIYFEELANASIAAFNAANAAFDRANLSNDVLLVDTVWLSTNAAFDKANAANLLAYNTGIGANAWSNTKLANTSGVTFDGNLTISSDLTIGNNLYSINSAFFDTTTVITTADKGQITWNGTEETFDLGMANGAILQVGQEIYYRVKNQTGSTITEGTVVMAAGTLGASGRLLVAPAIADGTYPSKYVMGIATTTMATGADGYVTHFGKVRGIDTSMWSEGDILYANVSTPGALQNTMPSAPNTKTTVAIVISKHAETGTLFVRPTYGSKLNEDELVELNGLTGGDVLQYVSANGRFENKQTLVSAYDKANSANVLAYNTGIGANAWSNAVGTAANSYAGAMANAANAYAASLTPDLSPAFNRANTAWDKANSANLLAYNTGIGANSYAGAMANSTNAYASDTYFTKSGGTISGDVVIIGNATISGVTTYANTQTLLIGDNILSLNADLPAAVAPSEDAGFEINRGSSANVSVVWKEGYDAWTLTSDGSTYYTIATNADITIANNYAGVMANAANAYAASLTPNLSPAFTVANAAFDKANSANVLAKNAYDYANTITSGGGHYQGNNGEVGSPTSFGDIFRTHTNTLTANVTIPDANNSIVAGPLTIGTYATLTISGNSRVVIL